MAKLQKKTDGIKVVKTAPDLRIQIKRRVPRTAVAVKLQRYADGLGISPSEAIYILAMEKLKDIPNEN